MSEFLSYHHRQHSGLKLSTIQIQVNTMLRSCLLFAVAPTERPRSRRKRWWSQVAFPRRSHGWTTSKVSASSGYVSVADGDSLHTYLSGITCVLKEFDVKHTARWTDRQTLTHTNTHKQFDLSFTWLPTRCVCSILASLRLRGSIELPGGASELLRRT